MLNYSLATKKTKNRGTHITDISSLIFSLYNRYIRLCVQALDKIDLI